MEQPHTRRTVWIIVAAGVVVATMLLLSSDPDPNTELARTAREAVAMAHDAQSDNRSAVLWSERFRLLAIVAGVSVPLVIVYLIWRSSSTGELDIAEVIQAMDKHALPGPGPLAEPGLPTNSSASAALPEHDDSSG